MKKLDIVWSEGETKCEEKEPVGKDLKNGSGACCEKHVVERAFLTNNSTFRIFPYN